LNPWKRKEVIGDATLYLGDCLEILPTLGKVDAVITDPPYGEKTHAGARTDSGETKLIEFASIDDATFQRFCRMAVDLSNRWVIMTCEWRHASKAEESGLPVIRLGVWIKPNGMPQMTGDRPATGWEAVLLMHRSGKKRWNGGGNPAVWVFNKENGEHPTTKPQGLIRKWLTQFTDANETVCDPFMGSGTTGVACANLGRKFIGIEIEPKYFDIACERIDNAYRQSRMFA
jgi:site-specific DNA-methyltransferase (adenine-specific)